MNNIKLPNIGDFCINDIIESQRYIRIFIKIDINAPIHAWIHVAYDDIVLVSPTHEQAKYSFLIQSWIDPYKNILKRPTMQLVGKMFPNGNNTKTISTLTKLL